MTPRCLWLAACASLIANAAHAVSVEKNATSDTYITQNASLGGPNSTHGGDSYLWAGGVPSDNPPYSVSNPLVLFDLAAYRGATVTGTAHFQLWLNGGAAAGNDAPRDLGVYTSATSWTEYDAKWDNYGPGVQYGVDTGPLIATQTGVAWPGAGERYITWDLPASVVQTWIDNPASNHGLLVRNLTESADRDLRFSSNEGSVKPHLTFDLANRIGDFNSNGALDASDIDLLLKQPSSDVPPGNPVYDLNADGKVITSPNAPNSDADFWLHSLLHTDYGDANLDGRVNFDDLVVVAMNYAGAGGKGWSQGNFTNDTRVDFDDLVLLAQHYNQEGFPGSVPASFAADWARAQSLVPEPTAAITLALGMLFTRRRAVLLV